MPSSPGPRVLVAFDKFKGALEAEAACDAARRAIRRLAPGATIDSAPLTDGGDGFCRILTRAVQGELHERSATGPRFEGGRAPQLPVSIGIVPLERLPPLARARLSLEGAVAPGAQRIAVIDMASVNGLARVPRERIDVWQSSSYGTGELILAGHALGADAILLGVGGSASSDLGLGALAALGLRFCTEAGDDVHPPLPAAWPHIARIAGALPAGLPPLRIACDVDNPVFGEQGAAAVYGPQKGLTPAERPRLEAQGQRLAALLCQHVGVSIELSTQPGSGAAGGIAFGLAAAAGARLVPGWALVEAWLGLDERLRAADWIITGEGRFDASSWQGKGPGSVVAAARALGRPAVVFAGSISDDARAGATGDCELIAVSDPAEPLEHALPATEHNLERRVEAWVSARLVAGQRAG
jgi:glycerate kinase